MRDQLSVGLIKLVLTSLMLVFVTACATSPKTSSIDAYGESEQTIRAKAHSDLGAAYLQQNKLEIALTEFTLATQIEANYSPAYNGLGLVYAALGENAKADANFRKSIQIQPKSSESHNNYGSFLCANKRYAESIPHFLEAVKNPLYPTPNLAYANAGICSARNSDVKNAEIYLVKALQIEPLTHSAAYQLAEIQFNRNEVALAKKTVQNTLLTNPSAESLWLGYKIERVLGGKDAQASYGLQLRKQYPSSEQTRLLLGGQ